LKTRIFGYGHILRDLPIFMYDKGTEIELNTMLNDNAVSLLSIKS